MITYPRHKDYLNSSECRAMKPCMKKPMTVHSQQINQEFRCKSLEGNYKQGKPGDYLMQGVKGELYICDKEIFEMSYDMIDDKRD